jgi:hypothetical protein
LKACQIEFMTKRASLPAVVVRAAIAGGATAPVLDAAARLALVEAAAPRAPAGPLPSTEGSLDVFQLHELGRFDDPQDIVDFTSQISQQGAHSALPRAEVERMSFSELAAYDLPPIFDLLEEKLELISRNTAPDDPGIRPARKMAQRLRGNLDLFASVYPRGGPHGWKVLRARVDKLYEALGDLKDLQRASPAANQGLGWGEVPSDAASATLKLHLELLPQLQERVAQAKAALTRDLTAFRQLLETPLAAPKGVKVHARKDSRFYWGGIDATPKRGLSGLDNIRRVMTNQIALSLRTSKTVLKLDDPIGPKRAKEFHDFRKRVRALIDAGSFFPEVFKDPVRGTMLQRQLYSLTHNYGLLQDRVVGVHNADAIGDTEGRAAAEAEIREVWPQIVKWQKDQRVKDVLKEFAAELAACLRKRRHSLEGSKPLAPLAATEGWR